LISAESPLAHRVWPLTDDARQLLGHGKNLLQKRRIAASDEQAR